MIIQVGNSGMLKVPTVNIFQIIIKEKNRFKRWSVALF